MTYLELMLYIELYTEILTQSANVYLCNYIMAM